MNKSITARKLAFGIVAAILLTVCLCITTYALLYISVSVDNNLFRTGKIEINLNDDIPIIDKDEFLFEPGMTVEKEFFIENKSTWDVYYKLYFENITGGLANVLEISIKDGDTVLYAGKAGELTRTAVGAAEEELKVGQKKYLAIVFHFPKEAGNTEKDSTVYFDVCADAVQTKNNPNKSFD